MLFDERVSFKISRPSCGRLHVPHKPFWRGADRLLAELKVVKQESEESVGNYGQRIEILLNRLLNTYDADRSLQNFEKLTYKKGGDSEALKQFLYGLQGDLQHQVRAANPKTLVEAITEALRIEQRTGARRVGTQSGPVSAEGILTEFREKYAKLKDDNQLEGTIRRAPAKARCGVCGMDNHPEDRCQYKDADTKLCIFCQKKGDQYFRRIFSSAFQ